MTSEKAVGFYIQDVIKQHLPFLSLIQTGYQASIPYSCGKIHQCSEQMYHV